MSTRNIIPRSDGEGSIGIPNLQWSSGVFWSISLNGLDLQSILDSKLNSGELPELSADNISFVPSGGLVSSDVQSAVLELDSYFSNHTGDSTIHVESGQKDWLDNILASYTEANYLLGTSGNIQDQLDTKVAKSDLMVSSMVFVDAVKGNDSIAVREDPGKPFKTLKAAENAASPGDTIWVGAGEFTMGSGDSSLGKDGVNWYFDKGSVIRVTETLPTTNPIFNLTGNSDTFSFSVDGYLEILGDSDALFRAVNIENEVNYVSLKLKTIRGLAGWPYRFINANNIKGSFSIMADSIISEDITPATIIEFGYATGPIDLNINVKQSRGSFSFLSMGQNELFLNHEGTIDNLFIDNDTFLSVAADKISNIYFDAFYGGLTIRANEIGDIGLPVDFGDVYLDLAPKNNILTIGNITYKDFSNLSLFNLNLYGNIKYTNIFPDTEYTDWGIFNMNLYSCVLIGGSELPSYISPSDFRVNSFGNSVTNQPIPPNLLAAGSIEFISGLSVF